ncbi:MAG: histidine phosphatase family protein [Streptosporangiaceae bacterium]|nr:histidine phosphatase family protein [Streptosporangiaceae bacterium]
MADILWARHGENVANLTRTLSYRVFDGDLTDTGRRQATELAERLASARLTGLFCSPLRRARQTAEVLGRRLRLRITAELDDLRELNVGALDGRNDPEAWDIYRRVLEAWRAGQPEVAFPEGENLDQLVTRLRRALAGVAGYGGRALVVAHGASLRAALPGLTGVPDPGHDLPTGGFATLRFDPEAVHLLDWPRRS